MISTAIWHLRSFWYKALDISHFGSLLALTMLTNVSIAGLSVISGVLAARLLGPTGRGELAAIQTWPTFLATLAMHGIADALAYYSAREPGRTGRWLATAIVLAVATCLPAAMIGYQLMPWLLQAQRVEIIEAARIYLLILPIYALVYTVYHPLRGRNDLTAWNLLRLLPALAWVGVLLIGVAWTGSNAIPLSRAYMVALALLLPLTTYVVMRRVPGPFRPSMSMVPPILRYGLPSALSSAPVMLNLRLDQMLMAAFLDSQMLGLYVVGVAWSSATSPILSALSLVVLPRVAGSQSPSQQVWLLAQSTRLGILFSLLLAAGTALAAPLAVPLIFGQNYLPVVPATMILSVAAGVAVINQLLESGALSLGHPKLTLAAETIGLIVTALLLWALLRPYKLMGAAVASLVSYLIVAVVLLYLLKRQTGVDLEEMIVPTRADFDLILTKWRAIRRKTVILGQTLCV